MQDQYFGFEKVTAEEKRERVDGVFDRVSARYDMMNDVLSAGLHRLWKDAAVTELFVPRVAPVRGYRVLDVAGGTGDMAFRILDRCAGARVVVADINASMMLRCREKRGWTGSGSLDFVQGDGGKLPFPDGVFDACTVAFGIRNMVSVGVALREMHRVLQPGGRFVCLEFSRVVMPVLDRLYDAYSFSVIPVLGRWLSGDEGSYRYLVESIRRFPAQAEFAKMLDDAGFGNVRYRNLSGGIAALHSGWRL